MTRTLGSALTPSADDAPVEDRATRGQDAVTVAIGLWLIGGLFSDGWAHHNVPELEGFFTPWHAGLYFGLLLAGTWFGWLGRGGGRRWYRRVPAGYGWGVVGIGVFAAGGLADMAWHLAFGVEAGIDALVSPSHLVLLTGGLLILTSAVRSRWEAGDIASPVAMGALTLVTALVSFFLLYVSEFTAHAPTIEFRALPEGHPEHTASELPATAGLGGFLITTALLVMPLVWTWQRGRAPRGLLTMLVALTSWLAAAVVDLDRAAVFGAAGATMGALVGEFALDWLENRRLPRRLRVPALAAAAIVPTWTAHMASLAVGVGLAWPVELLAGAVILSGLAAAALGGLAVSALPPPVNDAAARLPAPGRVADGQGGTTSSAPPPAQAHSPVIPQGRRGFSQP